MSDFSRLPSIGDRCLCPVTGGFEGYLFFWHYFMQGTIYYSHPLSKTLLSWSQEWMNIPSRGQIATVSLHQPHFVDSLTLKTLIRFASGKAGGGGAVTKSRVWKATEVETVFTMQWGMQTKRTDAIEVCFSLGQLERAADHACCDNYSSVNPSWKKPLLSDVLVLVWWFERHPQTQLWSGWNMASHWAHSTPRSV